MYLNQASSRYSSLFLFFSPQPGQKQEALRFLWRVQLRVLYISGFDAVSVPTELLFLPRASQMMVLNDLAGRLKCLGSSRLPGPALGKKRRLPPSIQFRAAVKLALLKGTSSHVFFPPIPTSFFIKLITSDFLAVSHMTGSSAWSRALMVLCSLFFN